MKKLSLLILVAVLFAACKKNPISNPSLTSNKIAGKWKIVKLTSIFLDSVGQVRDNGVQVYPGVPGYKFYFQFNTDGRWTEAFLPDSVTDVNANPSISSGNYVVNSDTSFTMYFTNSQSLNCKISTLTSDSLVFSRQYPTKYNGVTPGTIKRIFALAR